MATLVVKRASQYNAALRGLPVIIDGQKMGEVRNGETKEFPVTGGVHSVEFKMDWMSSGVGQLSFGDADRKEVEVSFCSAWLALPAILGMTKYIVVKPV
jgi:hypothetical protein